MKEQELLTIDPMDKPKKIPKKVRDLNKLLPVPPFRWSLIGESRSGKTTMLCNLFKKKFYGNFWKPEHIFVFAPTVNLDDKLKECIPANSGNFHDTFDQEILEEIYEQQQNIKDLFGKKKLDHILVILDDMLGSDALKSTSIISQFIHKTRHYNVSFIYSVQKYTGLPRVVRLNSDVMAIFRCKFGEVDNIVEELSDKKSRNKLRRIIMDIFNGSFDFLLINYQTTDLSQRYRRGFNKFIENIHND